MTDLASFLDRCWTDHAEVAARVALRLQEEALPLVRDEAGLIDLAHLAQHVFGEHLGLWAKGLAYLAALARLPAFDAQGHSGQALRRYRAALALAGGESDIRPTLSASDRIRVTAMAASALTLHDIGRAQVLLQEALAAADASDLPADDPMNRALAIAGHNLACTLEELPERSPEQRTLMILAADTSKTYWQRAGTWLETERAEYRLAMTWVAAGDPARARGHAEACLAICDEHQAAPLERFFGYEALCRAEHAAGRHGAGAAALEQARAAFAALKEADQGWCKATLEKIKALA